ncbi:MAG: TlpA family protein disulfide reductase [Thiotrichales bacterium]
MINVFWKLIALSFSNRHLERGEYRLARWVGVCLIALCAAAAPPRAAAEVRPFEVASIDGERLGVTAFAATGERLLIWLTEAYRSGERPDFQRTLSTLQGQGVEVWAVDLLESLFLTRTQDNVRQLSGEHVAALLRHALSSSSRQVALVASGQMAIPALKGLHAWQSSDPPNPRIDGAILFFPSLHAYTPVAGEDSELEPIVAATNYPVFLFQPAEGQMLAHLPGVLKALRQGGSPAYAWIQPGVRDWYFMHHADEPSTESELRWIKRLPEHLAEAQRLLRAAPKPTTARPLGERVSATTSDTTRGLVEWRAPVPAPNYDLPDMAGRRWHLEAESSQVLLVNFWASWCPPCVEEIPSMNRLAQRYDPKQFRILSINFREPAEEIRRFQELIHVAFPVLLDSDGATSADWKVFAFPSSFLLDRERRIRYSVNSAIAWDDAEAIAVIDGLLRETPSPAPP